MDTVMDTVMAQMEQVIEKIVNHHLDLGTIIGLDSAAVGFGALEALSPEDKALVIGLLRAMIEDVDKTGDLRRELGIELQ